MRTWYTAPAIHEPETITHIEPDLNLHGNLLFSSNQRGVRTTSGNGTGNSTSIPVSLITTFSSSARYTKFDMEGRHNEENHKTVKIEALYTSNNVTIFHQINDEVLILAMSGTSCLFLHNRTAASTTLLSSDCHTMNGHVLKLLGDTRNKRILYALYKHHLCMVQLPDPHANMRAELQQVHDPQFHAMQLTQSEEPFAMYDTMVQHGNYIYLLVKNFDSKTSTYLRKVQLPTADFLISVTAGPENILLSNINRNTTDDFVLIREDLILITNSEESDLIVINVSDGKMWTLCKNNQSVDSSNCHLYGPQSTAIIDDIFYVGSVNKISRLILTGLYMCKIIEYDKS